MPLFTSQREKRLWGWALAAVVAIYSTLGLARTLSDRLGQTGLGEWLFMTCCLLVLLAILTQGLKRRPGSKEIGVAIGIAAVYLLVFARMSLPTERSDLIEYGVVAILIYEAIMERASHGYQVPMPALIAILMTSVLGGLDEYLQYFIPGRVFGFEDILFNTLAAVMAVSAVAVLERVRSH